MKYADINALFTQKVAEYIGKGYVINSTTMAGHQGEIAKVDLRNDHEIIRIWFGTAYRNFRDGLTVMVGRTTDERLMQPMTSRRSDTLWTDNLEVIEERTFWQMQKGYREVDFYVEGEAGEKAIELHEKRCEQRFYVEHPQRVFENVETLVVKAVKRHLNRSSFKTANIKKVWKQWSADQGRYEYRVQTLKHTIVLG